MELPQLVLRGLQFLFTLLITALVGNVIAEAFAGNASAINYAIFVAVFSWIVLLLGAAAAFVGALAIPVVMIALDAVAALLTFIAGVVLAAKLGVHSCSNPGYTSTNHLTNGSNDPAKRCRELQASTAFFWFLFATYAASTALQVKSGGTSSIRGGGIRRGGQSMSQV